MSMTEEEIKKMQETNATLLASNKQLTDDTASMKGKMDELLTETKAAKNKSKEAAEAARLSAAETAKKKGDFEQLFNSSEENAKALNEELGNLKGGIAKEKVTNHANIIANKLAEGDNVRLLSTFIKPRLKYDDGSIKILDDKGQLSVMDVDGLVEEFKSNTVYASLLKGNQSSGGGAGGGDNKGGGADKIMQRADFDKLPADAKSKFTKDGGTITD